ncbi:MAG: glycosyltransferase family 2 protein [Eubacteriales bacterium]|nr:glycosyltransferase family 2 protein [Eubacteriales bacterium]
MRKKISMVVPCFNEEDNVIPMHDAITHEFTTQEILKKYDFDILYIDNDSKDKTRERLRELCKQDKEHVKAIFNVKNFGQFNSPYYGMLQADGDIVVSIACDFQDSPELIKDFVEGYEEGYKIVIGVKKTSSDPKLLFAMKKMYYHFARKFSSCEQIEQFTGFGLYDRDFIEVLKKLDDPTPFLRGIVAELGYKHKEIKYDQPKRRSGFSSNNFWTLYDAAMLSITSYTKIGLRIASVIGAISSFVAIIVAIVYLIMKLIWWDRFPAGMAPLLIGMLFLGSVQIFFIGLIGEYILTINQRVMKRPLVIEEERINFEPEKKEEEKKD